MHPDVAAVMADAAAHRAQYEAFCRSLSANSLIAPIPDTHWRVKDYIAHLATIDTWVADWFEHVAAGERWVPRAADGGPFNIDAWNEERIVERRDTPLEALLDEAAGHRAHLAEVVGRFTPAVLESRFDFRGNNITFLRYLQLWTAHDPAHSADMAKGLAPAEIVPASREWMAAAGFTLS